MNTLRFSSRSHERLFPGCPSPSQSPGCSLPYVCPQPPFSISSCSWCALHLLYGCSSQSHLALGHSGNLESEELWSQRGRAPAVAQLSHLESQAADLRELWLVEFYCVEPLFCGYCSPALDFTFKYPHMAGSLLPAPTGGSQFFVPTWL